MHSDPASLKNIVSKVLTWLIRTRWRRAIWGTLSVIKCKLSFQATRFSPFVAGKPQHNFVSLFRTMCANVFLYLRLNWVIEIILVMDLKRVVLCYFSDEEDCFPSRSHHSNSENGQNVPGRVSPQTAVGTLLQCEFYIPWCAFLIDICNLKHTRFNKVALKFCFYVKIMPSDPSPNTSGERHIFIPHIARQLSWLKVIIHRPRQPKQPRIASPGSKCQRWHCFVTSGIFVWANMFFS